MMNATLLAIEKIGPSLFLLKLGIEGGLKFKAGQFVSVAIPAEPEAGGAGPGTGLYCVASAEGEEPAELMVERLEGHASHWLCSRLPGESLSLGGPGGDFCLAHPTTRTQVFLGSRGGLAPLRSMILTLMRSEPAQHLHLFSGGRGTAELAFDSQWRALEDRSNKFHYHPVVQPTADNPFFGKNQDPADELIKKMVHRSGHDLYLAGFNRDVDPMRKKLEAAGFDSAFIRTEKFG